MYSFANDKSQVWGGIQDGQALEEFCRELGDQKFFSFDTETSGTSPWGGRETIGYSFAWRRQNGQIRSGYIPMRHKSHLGLFTQIKQLDPSVVLPAIRPALERVDTQKAAYNGTFDVHFAHADGIHVGGRMHDGMIAAKLLDENHPSFELNHVMGRSNIPHEKGWKLSLNQELGEIGKAFLGSRATTQVKDQFGYQYVSVDRMIHYGCQDASYEFQLAEKQIPEVARWSRIWDLEMRLFWVVVRLSRNGVPVDIDLLEALAVEQEGVMASIAPRLFQLAGREFDIGNDTEVRAIIYDQMGYPVGAVTDSGAPKLDDDALWDLEVNQRSEFAHWLRKYNVSQKIVSTYTRGIYKWCDKDHILHATFDAGGAKTGRVACRDPNLQNIPVRTAVGRRVRNAFVCTRRMIRSCFDYSQIELRMLADLSRDPTLLSIYHNDLDAHSITAKEVFGTDQKKDGVDMRRIAKVLNFGISFCMTDVGLRANVNKDLPAGQPPITEALAKFAINSFYTKYKTLAQFRESLWANARRNGGYFENKYGRPRRVEELLSPKNWQRNAGERQSMGSMVQGSSADLVKQSMVAVDEYVQAESRGRDDLAMVLMIHDDLQFDMSTHKLAKRLRDIKHLMEGTCQPSMAVPIKVDCEYFTTNWNEKKKLKF